MPSTYILHTSYILHHNTYININMNLKKKVWGIANTTVKMKGRINNILSFIYLPIENHNLITLSV